MPDVSDVALRPSPLAAAVLALTCSLAAQAGSVADDVGRVEVVGAATAPALSSGARYVLTGADLAALGARTLDQALALLPGLNVRNGAEGVPRIDIRGLKTRQVRLLLDGVPMNSVSDGQFDPTLIPVALIDSIVVSTGATSVLYGEGGTAGTIQIVTRRGQGAASGSATLEGGDGRRGLGGAQLAGSNGDWDYALGAEIAEQHGTPLASGTATSALQPEGLRVNSDSHRRNVLGRLGWRAGEAWRVALRVTGVQADRGSPPSAVAAGTDVFAQNPRYDRIANLEGSGAQVSAAWTASADTSVRGWVYGNRQAQDEQRFDDASLALLKSNTIKGGFDLHTTTAVTGGHLQASTALGEPWRLAVALDSRREQFDQAGRVRDVAVTTGGSGSGTGGGKGTGSGSGSTTTTYSIRNVNDSNAVRVESLAAELAWRPVPGMRWVAGAGDVRQQRVADARSGHIGSLDVSQQLGDGLSLRAGVAQRVRAPSLAQLYDSTSGNAALNLERNRTAELGLAWQGEPTEMQATAFHNDVHDLIRNDDTTGRATNLDHVVLQGLELQGRWQPMPGLSLAPGWTWLHSDNRSPNATSSTLAYTPRHKLTLDARWQALPTLSLGASVLHVRDQVYDARSGTPQQGALPAYTVVGLQAAWRLAPVTLTLRLDNALDEAYATSYGFPQPGRSASLRADVAF